MAVANAAARFRDNHHGGRQFNDRAEHFRGLVCKTKAMWRPKCPQIQQLCDCFGYTA
jgi:hypothetical protein